MFPLQDTIPARNVPLVTWTIILLNAVVFYVELSLPPQELQSFLTLVGMVPARLRVDSSAWFTLVTCMFLHGGWMHFIGNMSSLYLFGDNVEDRMGPIRYLLFYLLCGIAAGLTHFAANPDSPLPSIGASGAISGVFGAYFLLFPRARVLTLVLLIFVPVFVEIPAVFYLGVWFLMQLFSGTLAVISTDYYTGVAWWAHIGGFVAGMILLPLFQSPKREHRGFYQDEYQPW
jgi:membrane associated rhomboid family serine protease